MLILLAVSDYWMAREKIEKIEAFLSEQLEPDLNTVLTARDKVYEELAEYAALENAIKAILASNLRPGQPLKTKVDLGCNFYCQGIVKEPSKIFLDIGLGFHLECELSEALILIKKRVAILDTRVKKLTEEACKVKANIKLTLQGLKELQNIKDLAKDSEKRHRDVLS